MRTHLPLLPLVRRRSSGEQAVRDRRRGRHRDSALSADTPSGARRSYSGPRRSYWAAAEITRPLLCRSPLTEVSAMTTSLSEHIANFIGHYWNSLFGSLIVFAYARQRFNEPTFPNRETL